MKLGIVVVYLFEEASAPLMEIHLRHIEHHTRIPYVIYAGVNRLGSRFRDELARRPEVRICECPDTPLRGMKEHAHYLEHLVRLAVEDGVSHVATLHLDSFPICSGWAEELAGKLSSSCALVTIDRINTACLFFDREFYLCYQPSFLLSTAERECAGYRRYIDEFDPLEHSGIGYGFTAYRNGKSWHYMKDTTVIDYTGAGRVYDDTIFHLGGAVHIGERYSRESGGFQSAGWGRFMKMVVAAARVGMPRPVRMFLTRRFRAFIERFVDKPQFILHAQNIRRFKEDPEKYLRLLRKDGR